MNGKNIRRLIFALSVLMLLLAAVPTAMASMCVTPYGQFSKHAWGEWHTIKEATCKEKGQKEHTCTRCGEREIKSIDKKGHSYGKWSTVKEASCSKEGERKRKCKVCGHVKTETIEKKAHSWGEWTVVTEPASRKAGLRSHKCLVCGTVGQEALYPDGTLRRGDRGDAVKALQGKLNENGFDCGKADGIFGKGTESAVSELETALGIEADGIAWPDLIGEFETKGLGGGDGAPPDTEALGIGGGDDDPPDTEKTPNIDITLSNTNPPESSFFELNDEVGLKFNVHNSNVDLNEIGYYLNFPDTGKSSYIISNASLKAAEKALYGWSISVTFGDTVRGHIDIYVTATCPDPEDPDKLLTFTSNTIRVATHVPDPVPNIDLTLSNTNPPESSFFELNDVIRLRIDARNSPVDINEIDYYLNFPDTGESSHIISNASLKAAGADLKNWAFLVNIADAVRGHIDIYVTATCPDPSDSDKLLTFQSNTLTVNTRKGDIDDQVPSIRKAEYSRAHDNKYYREGEIIIYKIDALIPSGTHAENILITDTLAAEEEPPVYEMASCDDGAMITSYYYHRVTEAEIFEGYVFNYADLYYYEDCDLKSFETEVVKIELDPQDQHDAGCVLKLVMAIDDKPEQGGNYVEGEEVTFVFTVENHTGRALDNASVYVPLYSATQPLKFYGDIPEDFTDSFTYNYTVTAADANIIHNVISKATFSAVDTLNRQYSASAIASFYADSTVKKAELTVKKDEISARPVYPDGSYYAELDKIDYRIRCGNTGETDLKQIYVYDDMDGSQIGYCDVLKPNEIYECSYSHMVNPDDVSNKAVYNTATAYYYTINDIKYNVTSNQVASPTCKEDDPVTGDSSYSGGSSYSDDFDAEPADAVDRLCTRTLVGRTTDSLSYELHSCAVHAATRDTIEMMLGTAADKDAQAKVWQYAETLWRNDIDRMYAALARGRANTDERAAVMDEATKFYAMADSFKEVLTRLHPDDPALVAEKVAELMMQHAADLCYESNAEPEERPDQMLRRDAEPGGDSREVCVCTTAELESGDRLRSYDLCAGHAITLEMTDLMLQGVNTPENWDSIAMLWQIDMNSFISDSSAKLDAQGNAELRKFYTATQDWLEARRAILGLIYTDKPEIVSEVAAEDLMALVIASCGK